MARNVRAKKKKARAQTKAILNEAMREYAREVGEQVYCLTQSAIEEIKQDAIKFTLKSAASLLEYNMILENHLTPAEAKEQSHLMEVRAQAIVDGHLSWEEIDEFLEEHYAKEEQSGEV